MPDFFDVPANVRNLPPATDAGVDAVNRGKPLWWVKRLDARLAARSARLALYENYYLGQHNLQFATKKFREAFGPLFSDYAENICELIIEAASERLSVVGFRVGDQVEADPDAWRIWQANQLDAWQSVAHETALVKEESYLLVWRGDDDRTPSITVEDPQQMIVETAASDRRMRLAALKRWFDLDTARTFATLYLPDAIWKFQSRGKDASEGMSATGSPRTAWVPREIAGEPWPLPNPLGVVPVVPLVNRPRLIGGGVSELKSVIPINNAINKLVSDMLLAAEFGAFRQRWAANVTLELDGDTGKPKEPWTVAVDRMLTAPPPENGEPEVKFGEFSETNLTNYVKAIEQRLQMAATISRTPAHYILGSMGSFPSGESLNATEAGLVAKCRNKMLFFGEGHEEAIRLAFQVIDDPRGAITDSEAVWKDPEHRTESQHVDALVKLQGLGVPDEQLWADAGYSPQQIASFKEMAAIKRSVIIERDAAGNPIGASETQTGMLRPMGPVQAPAA